MGACGRLLRACDSSQQAEPVRKEGGNKAASQSKMAPLGMHGSRTDDTTRGERQGPRPRTHLAVEAVLRVNHQPPPLRTIPSPTRIHPAAGFGSGCVLPRGCYPLVNPRGAVPPLGPGEGVAVDAFNGNGVRDLLLCYRADRTDIHDLQGSQ